MMSLWFRTAYVSEPQLVFGGQKEDKDPKIGLSRFGPYHYSDEDRPLESLSIGIISNREGITVTKDILELIKGEIPSYKQQNRWLFPDFPGVNKESHFQCSLKFSENWNGLLSDDLELNKLEKVADPNERIAQGVNLFVEKMKLIAANDDQPNVVICTLPKIVEEYCGISEKTRGAKTAKATKAEIEIQRLKDLGQTFLTDWGLTIENEEEKPDKAYDFRNALKGKIMQFGIPIQILHQTTCEHTLNYASIIRPTKEDPCSFAWNLSTALYYKANGKPWRLAKLPVDACYVGISFFRDKLHPTKDIQISMAQVFTHNGEGLVLRGTEVDIDEHSKQPYLRKEQAKELLSRSIARYIEKARRNPTRVVIHKTSEFSDHEIEGFNESILAIGNLLKDFITIRTERSGINFMRIGKYPLLRGTIIHLDSNQFLLYTSGFSPRLRTYPGHSIPNPLKIIHYGDSTSNTIAAEILGLTKLNWNTTSFSTYLPITVKFADEVGKILSELPLEEQVEDHYRFFM